MEWSDEEELMDLVMRKYAPSTLPYPLLFVGGSTDEETAGGYILATSRIVFHLSISSS